MEIEIFPELKREIDAHRLSMHFHRSHPVAAFYEGGDGAFPALCRAVTLTELDISDSLVTDISFGFVRLLTRLEQLSLQNTAITGRLLKVIRDLPTLRVLTCNPYVEASRAAEAICDCKTLKRLDLSHGHWTANEFVDFLKLPSLESLSVSCCPLLTLSDLATNTTTTLTRLLCSGTLVNDLSCKAISQLSGLKVLSVAETSVGNRGIEYLKNLNLLEELNLSFTQITSLSMDALQCLPKLNDISVVGVKLNHEFTKKILSMNNLRAISFSRSLISNRDLRLLKSSRDWLRFDCLE